MPFPQEIGQGAQQRHATGRMWELFKLSWVCETFITFRNVFLSGKCKSYTLATVIGSRLKWAKLDKSSLSIS